MRSDIDPVSVEPERPARRHPWRTPRVITSELQRTEMPAFVTHTDSTVAHGIASQS